MADPAARAKGRIIGHMNKDHSDSVQYYVQTLTNVKSPAAAAEYSLTDITPSSLVVSDKSGNSVLRLPIDPPLKDDLSDARIRLVEMDKIARKQLGIPDAHEGEPGAEGTHGATVRSGQYVAPGLADWGVGLAVGFYFASLLARPYIVPGTSVYSFLEKVFPWHGAEGFRWLVKTIAVPVLIIHIVETWWIGQSRFKSNGVDALSKDGLLWRLSCFFEGMMAFKRFDRTVAAGKKKA